MLEVADSSWDKGRKKEGWSWKLSRIGTLFLEGLSVTRRGSMTFVLICVEMEMGWFFGNFGSSCNITIWITEWSLCYLLLIAKGNMYILQLTHTCLVCLGKRGLLFFPPMSNNKISIWSNNEAIKPPIPTDLMCSCGSFPLGLKSLSPERLKTLTGTNLTKRAYGRKSQNHVSGRLGVWVQVGTHLSAYASVHQRSYLHIYSCRLWISLNYHKHL